VAPVALGLLAAALFGAATPASKRLLADLSPLQLSGLLYLGAALAVAPAALRGGLGRALPRDRTNAIRLLGVTFVGGLLGPVLLLLGLREASAASVSLWLNLELAATAALGALAFGDHLGARGWLGCAGVAAASALLALGEGAAGLGAGLLVAAACVCWGLDNQWTALLDGLSPAASTLWKGLAAGSVSLALGVGLGTWRASAETTAAALAVGALAYGASIALSVRAAHGLGATRAQVVFSSAPFFGLALSATLLGEPVGGPVLGAAALLLGSIALVLGDRHAHSHAHAPLAHTHPHRHDDRHHDHRHEGEPASLWHTHWHEHDARSHAHRHWPDLHHRHPHPHPH
jgi:drug/metabolite transporter (DMT)-like permease